MPSTTETTTYNPLEICRMIASLCESGGRLNQITEIPEEEVDEEELAKRTEKEMFEAVEQAEASYEFASLKSGSMPVDFSLPKSD